MFERIDGTWTETAKLLPPSTHQADLFGDEIAVHQDWIVVCDRLDHTFGVFAGAAHIFQRIAGNWLYVQSLASPEPSSAGLYGRSVALGDGVLAIGMAPGRSDLAGTTYVYRLSAGRWVLQAELIPSTRLDGDSFGARLALADTGTLLAIGAPAVSTLVARPGHVHVFDLVAGSWTERWASSASDGVVGDLFGLPAIDGDTLLVGAPGQSSSVGHAYVFAGIRPDDCNENETTDGCDIFFGTSEDLDGDGVPDECDSVTGDVNGDGRVGMRDVLLVLQAWGPCGQPCSLPCPEDLNHDCVVAASDLAAVLSAWTR